MAHAVYELIAKPPGLRPSRTEVRLRRKSGCGRALLRAGGKPACADSTKSLAWVTFLPCTHDLSVEAREGALTSGLRLPAAAPIGMLG